MNESALTTFLTSDLALSPLMAQWGAPLLVFAVVATVLYLIGRLITCRPSPDEIRVRNIRPEISAAESENQGPLGSLTQALAAQIPESPKERRDFRLLLRQAGIYRPGAAATIYALRFVLLFVPLVAAGVWAVLVDEPPTWKILGLGGITAGALSVIPRLYVFFRRRRRRARIRAGLPDTIDMLSMCFSGGLGLNESLEHVAGQMSSYPELAQELTILKRQIEVGSLKQALVDLTTRVELPEMRQLAGLLTRGVRLGTQLAGSLNEQADHLRTARRQMATTRANKIPVKLVLPILFCFAPAALILLTAPAVMELRDFLVPSAEMAKTARPGEVFGTGQIVETLQGLEQSPQPFIVGPDADEQYPY